MIAYSPLKPWSLAVRQCVLAVACDMDPLDREEIFGLRPAWHEPAEVVRDLAAIVAAPVFLDGFLACRMVGDDLVPVAVAVAWRAPMPKVADLAFFGRKGHRRAMVEIYQDLAERSASFGRTHGVDLLQVPIFEGHRAARRMARELGGRETFNYGPVGSGGQSYVHTIWRFPRWAS